MISGLTKSAAPLRRSLNRSDWERERGVRAGKARPIMCYVLLLGVFLKKVCESSDKVAKLATLFSISPTTG